jgi:cytochrome oxidase Cu insertion factor (SCO1/SenC/PrrC family)
VSYFAAIPATGLTGSKEQIDYAVKQFAASYEIVPSNSAAGPSVNHTTSLYLIDADGKVRHKFSHADEPDAIVAALRDQA